MTLQETFDSLAVSFGRRPTRKEVMKASGLSLQQFKTRTSIDELVLNSSVNVSPRREVFPVFNEDLFPDLKDKYTFKRGESKDDIVKLIKSIEVSFYIQSTHFSKSFNDACYSRGIQPVSILSRQKKTISSVQYASTILDEVEESLNITILREVKFDWTKIKPGSYYRYDGQIAGSNILIELDGISHFNKEFYKRSIKQSFEDTCFRDKEKTRLAKEHGFILLRFRLPTRSEVIVSSILQTGLVSPSKRIPGNIYYLIQVADRLGHIPSVKEYDRLIKELNLNFPTASSLRYHACWESLKKGAEFYMNR